jgi:hypothetical protein
LVAVVVLASAWELVAAVPVAPVGVLAERSHL